MAAVLDGGRRSPRRLFSLSREDTTFLRTRILRKKIGVRLTSARKREDVSLLRHDHQADGS